MCNDTHGSNLSPMLADTILQTNHTHNEMLSHYNHIVIGSFKDIVQTVDTNNLLAVLQSLKELNFILANRAPELSALYGFPLEPWQVPAEEIPDVVHAYLNRPTANATEHSSGGRPRTRDTQLYRPSRQSLPVPRYNSHANRSDSFHHSNRARSSFQSRYGDRDRCHMYSSPTDQYQHSQANNPYHNSPHIANDINTLNTSELIGLLQSQIICLQSQSPQQSTFNSIKNIGQNEQS